MLIVTFIKSQSDPLVDWGLSVLGLRVILVFASRSSSDFLLQSNKHAGSVNWKP